MWDISDLKEDVVEHVKVIGTGMKKTISGPFLSKRTETERTPLLSNDSTVNANVTVDYPTQVLILYHTFPKFNTPCLLKALWEEEKMLHHLFTLYLICQF